MSTFSTLQVSDSDGIRVITISREKVLNALNATVLSELHEAFKAADTDGAVRGIIVTGSGEKAFVAGADISEFQAITNSDDAAELAKRGQEIFQAIEDSRKPVVAAINGFALGGGFELALACHFRIMSPTAKLGLPEVKLGLLPGYGGTQRLSRQVGRSKALELILTASMIDAAEALRLGIVNSVSDDSQVLTASIDFLKRILAFSNESISGVLLATSKSNNDTSGYQAEAVAFGKCLGSANGREGVKAFLEKRAPNFSN